MAYFDRNMQVFRTIHRVFHSFAHNWEKDVENFFAHKISKKRFDKCQFLWYNWVKKNQKAGDSGQPLQCKTTFLKIRVSAAPDFLRSKSEVLPRAACLSVTNDLHLQIFVRKFFRGRGGT